jgi:hypothetical protein
MKVLTPTFFPLSPERMTQARVPEDRQSALTKRKRWGGRPHSTASVCQNGCVGTIKERKRPWRRLP